MAQDDDGAVMLGEALESVANQFGLFVGFESGVGREVGGGLAVEVGKGVVAVAAGAGDFEGSLGTTFKAAKFVVTKIHRDAPEVGGEAGGGLIIFAIGI